MSLTIVGVILAVFTGYLLLEDWWWQRQHKQRKAARARTEMARVISEMHAGGSTVRCLMHEQPVVVEDLGTHLRLWHQPREVGAEDRAGWSA